MATALSGAGWAVRTQFFCSGFIFATWACTSPRSRRSTPSTKRHWGWRCWRPASVPSSASAGRWIGRHGAARTTLATGAICALLDALLIHMPSYAALLALMVVFGVVASVFEVAINTEASQLERLGGRPLMSGMHGMFSLGGMAGAVSGGIALAAGMAPAWHLALLTPSPWVALAGFAGVGIGFAHVVPVLFAAAAQVPGVAPARGIAAVSAAAYLGFMAGPPVIGFLARGSSLTAALGVAVVFALALAMTASRATRAISG